MSAEKYYSGNNTQAPPSQAQNYAPPQGPPPTHDQRGFNDYNQGQPQGQQGYYQQGPPQYGGQQGGYYQQGPPQGQQGYYQQQQPVYVQQKPPRDNSQDCCMACLAAMCICCTLDAIF